MVINHNLSSMNALRNTNINSAHASNSMEKLSSGLRINKAGDDAAGLAISEKMRGQIRGLDQASSNAQDAISLIGTAEGALSETTSILQRMRELAVQGATDTNTVDDRDAMQKEISQLSEELDRIGNTTEFNTKKLLNGDISTKILAAGSSVTGLSTSAKTVDGVYSLDVTSQATKATVGNAAAFGVTTASKIQINDTQIDIAAGESLKSVIDKINLVSDQTKVNAMVGDQGGLLLESQETGSATTLLVTGTNAQLLALGLTTGAGTALSAAGTDAAGNLGGVAFTAEGNTITGQSGSSVEGLKLQLAGTETAASHTYAIADADGAAGADTYTINGTAVAIANGDTKAAIVQKINDQKDKTGVTAALDSTGNNLVLTSTAVGANAQFSFETVGATGGLGGAIAATTYNGTSGIDPTNLTGNTDGTVRVASSGNLDFHIGANEGQQLRVGINDMRASVLGGALAADKIDKVDVTTKEGAEKAITNIDAAIKTVSQERAKLGAVSNRLDHTIANLGTSSENLTSAESRIRDVDMAKEMSTYTKNNILAQAAQSMLSQANQQPQQVLNLLR